MPELTKQILLKISPELDDLIDQGLSLRLKEFGKPITKSEFIRQILTNACPKIDLKKCLHLVCAHILTKETVSFQILDLSEFGSRPEVEIIFNELVKKHQVADWYNNAFSIIGNFKFDQIKSLAKKNVSLDVEEFITKVFKSRYPPSSFFEMEKERYWYLIPILEENLLIEKFGLKDSDYDFTAYAAVLFKQKGA